MYVYVSQLVLVFLCLCMAKRVFLLLKISLSEDCFTYKHCGKEKKSYVLKLVLFRIVEAKVRISQICKMSELNPTLSK